MNWTRRCRAALMVLAFAAGIAVQADTRTARQSYADLADKLARRTAKLKIKQPRILVGDFPCANHGHQGISTMSRVIQDRLTEALGNTDAFTVIARDHLEKLVREKKLQNSNLVNPETMADIRVDGFDAIVDGRYNFHNLQVTVTLRLTVTDGGQRVTVTGDVPVTLVGADDVLPPEKITDDVQNKLLRPQKTKERVLNIKKAARIVKGLANRDIRVELWVEGGRTHFMGGETIRYIVRADHDCYLTIFCHQIDGTTVQLFPNQAQENAFVRKDQMVTVPGKNAPFEIEISEPFGTDIVQVIACTQPKRQTVIRNQLNGYRGMTVRQKFFTNQDAANAKWGERRIQVSTYPRK